MKLDTKKTAITFDLLGKKFQVMTFKDAVYHDFKVDTFGNVHIFFKRKGGRLSGSTLSVEAIRQQLPLYYMEKEKELPKEKVNKLKVLWNKFISKLFFVR